jgi:hypothetical protein
MKTYKETENYRMLVNFSYTLFNFVTLYKIFDWELVNLNSFILGMRIQHIFLLTWKIIWIY